MKTRYRLLSVYLCFQTLATSGCSLFVPWREHVTIIPSDPQANVLIDNQPAGVGQVDVDLMRNRSYSIAATAHGQVGTANIDYHVSVTGVLDIVGTFFFIFPVIGVFTPGFWDLDPTVVHVPIPAAAPMPGGVYR